VMERCARGVLRCCSHLTFKMLWRDPMGQQVLEAALSALGRWWRPDPSLVDGSSPSVGAQGDAEGNSHLSKEGRSLTLYGDACIGRALEALPEGLTCLKLR
jgi:hypothetical protein